MPARTRQRLFLVVIGILATSMLLGVLWTLRADRTPRGADALQPPAPHGLTVGFAADSEP